MANDHKRAQKELGERCAKIFQLRLQSLSAATSLEEVRHLPGRFHELIGNRKGQWACDLEHPYRLIFEPHENPIPQNEHGIFVWFEIRGVAIIEIADYH